FPEAGLIGIGAQGWLRQLDGARVRRRPPDPRQPIKGDVVFLSENDFDGLDAIEAWARDVPLMVVTRGSKGCTVRSARGCMDVPAFPVPETDPTGAGDVFAAAFLVRYRETGDPLAAARFASAAAALCVQAPGLDGIGSRPEIEGLIRAGEAGR